MVYRNSGNAHSSCDGTLADLLAEAQHTRAKKKSQNTLFFTQKGTQPSQASSERCITRDPAQKSMRLMPFCLWGV
jgi:hypothetical protein